MRGVWWIPLVVLACNKSPKEVAPIEGWHQEEGWTGACWYPKNFDELGPGDSRVHRQETLEAMMSQWTGGRDDGISFDEITTTNVETILLGEPEKIEMLAVGNLEQCQRAMAGGGQGEWKDWLVRTANQMTDGQCQHRPMRYTLFDYLNIGSSWHIPVGVCEGDHIRIKATVNDLYRISEDGPWINTEGDPSQPSVGADWPCNIEGCYAGQLIMRFVGDSSGIETIMPVGVQKEWIVPEHGQIDIMINDTTYYDNVYKIEGGIEHHTAIEYSPVGD